jgi:hypothetical protein
MRIQEFLAAIGTRAGLVVERVEDGDGPELRIRKAAAHTRIVSGGEFWPGSTRVVTSFQIHGLRTDSAVRVLRPSRLFPGPIVTLGAQYQREKERRAGEGLQDAVRRGIADNKDSRARAREDDSGRASPIANMHPNHPGETRSGGEPP